MIAYDWERDLPTAKLHQSEADAFHIIAFALVEVLDNVFISQRSSSDIRAEQGLERTGNEVAS